MIALVVTTAFVLGLPLVVGGSLVVQCIARGFGSLKGCPLPPRWWEQP